MVFRVILALGQVMASVGGLLVGIGLFRLLFKLGRAEGRDIPSAWRRADPDRYARYGWLPVAAVSLGAALARYAILSTMQGFLIAGYRAVAIVLGGIVAIVVFATLGGLALRKQGLEGLGQSIGLIFGVLFGMQAFAELLNSLSKAGSVFR